MAQGAPGLSNHHKVKPELVSMTTGHAVRLRVVDQIILDRMLMRDLITKEQFDTANAFRADLFKAGITGPGTSSMGPRAQLEPSQMGDNKAMALMKVGQAISDLDAKCGRKIRQAVIDLCLDLLEPRARWATEGLDVLRVFRERWRANDA